MPARAPPSRRPQPPRRRGCGRGTSCRRRELPAVRGVRLRIPLADARRLSESSPRHYEVQCLTCLVRADRSARLTSRLRGHPPPAPRMHVHAYVCVSRVASGKTCRSLPLAPRRRHPTDRAGATVCVAGARACEGVAGPPVESVHWCGQSEGWSD
eukprot:359124-Chlamydomonas_euryale.AAC.1